MCCVAAGGLPHLELIGRISRVLDIEETKPTRNVLLSRFRWILSREGIPGKRPRSRWHCGKFPVDRQEEGFGFKLDYSF